MILLRKEIHLLFNGKADKRTERTLFSFSVASFSPSMAIVHLSYHTSTYRTIVQRIHNTCVDLLYRSNINYDEGRSGVGILLMQTTTLEFIDYPAPCLLPKLGLHGKARIIHFLGQLLSNTIDSTACMSKGLISS